ncbi:type 2 DNA topoisomerase 6 subunit B-like [Dendrobium catenatum]|uniref:type 2 DNA topoisomerase 6 subunit B-like n=1 Tax=Dendrobium catenatum TaxID=906689 RepID=UPI0010A02014|nr:type 2 DNA topoisomerase 6 subunit B-like [Dendrobium catenatum]
MASESSAVRKVFQMLISLAIQRCRQSGILCRLTVSIKCFHELEAPSMRISVSDTGVGSSLEEFRTMDLEAHLYPWDKWDGLLSITNTSINEKDIHCYRLNLQEAVFSRRRLKRLPSISKQFGTFSGTEVYFSTNEENTDEFVTWVVHFVQKMLVLKVQDIVVDLSVQNMDNNCSIHEQFLPKTEDPSLVPAPLSESNIEAMSSGLEDYILKHRGSAEIVCSVRREDLKVGMGHASNLKTARNAGHVFDVAIVIVPASTVPCCLRASSQTTEVLYFQNFSPSSIPKIALSTLEGIKWPTYGLKLKEILVDGDGFAVLQWEDLPLAHMDIAIHSFYIKYPSCGGDTSKHPCMHLSACGERTEFQIGIPEYPYTFLGMVGLETIVVVSPDTYHSRLFGMARRPRLLKIFLNMGDARRLLKFKVKYTRLKQNTVTELPTRQETTERKFLRKAIKTALDDLKTKYAGLFLSSHSRKIQKYAPDLSRSIASLIVSANDQEFQRECASLLGLDSEDSNHETLELCIQEKLMKIICVNDMKKGARDSAPNLFESEPLYDDDCIEDDGDDGDDDDVDDGILDLC